MAVLFAISRTQFNEIKKPDIKRADAIYIQLKKAKEQYEKQQNKTIEKFSQFVLLDKDLQEPYTLTLKDYKTYFVKPDSDKDLENSLISFKFNSGLKVEYIIDKGKDDIIIRKYFKPWKSILFK